MQQTNYGLYDPSFEHDACGIGAVVQMKGKKSYRVVDDALKIVEKLEHRAGKDATGEVGDGVGIMLQVCHSFFQKIAQEKGYSLGNEREYGVGMFFFPQDIRLRTQAQKMLEVIVQKEGLEFGFWREVPVHPEILGKKARDCMPSIYQCIIRKPQQISCGIDFDRKLYVVRRTFEQSGNDTYVVSLSSRTIVYKGMFLVNQLRDFYEDLRCGSYESAMALVHSRFSTNTNPSWERAHPNRFLLHNGEINTIRGNMDRMLAREETMHSDYLQQDMDKILPVVDENGSDSAVLDNTIEFLVMNGMELPMAMMVTIPEPWESEDTISREKRDFYRYYATMMEPWDGPASILFSDGDLVGATLDRNGLRPSRYYVTDDDFLILASEVGVLDIPPEKILSKSRLEPGKMLVVDMVQGTIISDEELKAKYACRQPYGEWLDQNVVPLASLKVPNQKVEILSQNQRDKLYKAFGYTYEDLKTAVLPMARDGSEQTAAMGVDIPIAVLSDHHQPLFNYFKQSFAQVTNPPIDAIREKIVTSTTVYAGADGNLLQEKAENCTVLQINNPILTSVDMLKIKNLNQNGLKTEVVSLLYYRNTPVKKALDRLFVQVDKAYKNGANIIVLSDRGVDENHVAIPSLLAVSAVEQYLIKTKKRTAVSIILESGEPRDVHHFATLLGYGAIAVNPYLAHEAIGELIEKNMLNKDLYVAIEDYNKAILNGVVKIASKMGISTIQSYQSAQIFEAIGIQKSVIDEYFTNTVSRVEGIGLKEIDQDIHVRHAHAFDPLGLGVDTTLDSSGSHNLRTGHDKDDHLYSPQVIVTLQQAVRTGDFEKFQEYTALVDDETKPHTLRGLLDFVFDPEGGIPLEEVEPASQIVKRFKTGAMSYGSISEEAHKCMAEAMNRIGGKSNSGEGGELPQRLNSSYCSAIKQVASGRFGVTSEYLISAKEIQIKMAQGAKPGEGGHLPGKKVYPWIAKTRYSTPGVSLISPPPHHDIYSIEDLAQLIYDLKNANVKADISVKLVSEAGVGTVAAGVAKAGASVILISGYDGGTGAAPRSSIHNAGMPWELGLSEAHQTLMKNGLRSRVRIETDGKLMSGRDVAIACMLGAEEFGFATGPLVSMGCMMMRVCNLDTCPFGIATQNPELRKRFSGKPEYIVNYMYFIAEELRRIMAKLGVHTVDELVGRTDLLKKREVSAAPRGDLVDVSNILAAYTGTCHYAANDAYDFELEKTVDETVILPKLRENLEKGQPGQVEISVSSTDRTVGTRFGSEVTRKYGTNLKEDTFRIICHGGGGQSFGAFLPSGVTMVLSGDSNDYFGKGLSGGKLIVFPPKESRFPAEENIIIGNVAFYGATSGKAYINGIAGERFCVRNSGVTAVVEGVGDHGCEYMTGGTVVILGPVGKNFAAGMSGGIAYVLDLHHDLYRKVNKGMVFIENVTEAHDREELRRQITEHVRATNSKLGKQILDEFDFYAAQFKKIVPNDYQKMLNTIAAFEKTGMSREEAEVEAFYQNTGR
ncbi:MAG: glutamate synthase large subunit [Massiliimalia sp.]|jgi:glutamate synthase (NADPH/NADH) large chain